MRVIKYFVEVYIFSTQLALTPQITVDCNAKNEIQVMIIHFPTMT